MSEPPGAVWPGTAVVVVVVVVVVGGVRPVERPGGGSVEGRGAMFMLIVALWISPPVEV